MTQRLSNEVLSLSHVTCLEFIIKYRKVIVTRRFQHLITEQAFDMKLIINKQAD